MTDYIADQIGSAASRRWREALQVGLGLVFHEIAIAVRAHPLEVRSRFLVAAGHANGSAGG